MASNIQTQGRESPNQKNQQQRVVNMPEHSLFPTVINLGIPQMKNQLQNIKTGNRSPHNRSFYNDT